MAQLLWWLLLPVSFMEEKECVAIRLSESTPKLWFEGVSPKSW